MLLPITNGVGDGFSIVMGVIGVIEVILILVLGLLALIEIKMNRLKKDDYSSGY